jgi:hypothetical protein
LVFSFAFVQSLQSYPPTTNFPTLCQYVHILSSQIVRSMYKVSVQISDVAHFVPRTQNLALVSAELGVLARVSGYLLVPIPCYDNPFRYHALGWVPHVEAKVCIMFLLDESGLLVLLNRRRIEYIVGGRGHDVFEVAKFGASKDVFKFFWVNCA